MHWNAFSHSSFSSSSVSLHSLCYPSCSLFSFLVIPRRHWLFNFCPYCLGTFPLGLGGRYFGMLCWMDYQRPALYSVGMTRWQAPEQCQLLGSAGVLAACGWRTSPVSYSLTWLPCCPRGRLSSLLANYGLSSRMNLVLAELNHSWFLLS